MTIKKIENKLRLLFKEYFFENAETVKRIKGGVSERLVYKIKSKNYVCAGIYNAKLKENKAFIEFSKTLKAENLNVPEIYCVSDEGDFYLEEFLGDKNLFDLIKNKNTKKTEKINLYKKALSDLIEIQLRGNKVINYKYCYETKTFNKKQIFFDFNKFYNYYLSKLTEIKYSKNKIRTIKNEVLKEISKERNLYFMYRDFQPRNIMIKDGELFYIDYQSGRKGYLQYDLASFLYSGSIEIEDKERKILLNHYINNISKQIKINKINFKSSFYYFAFIRLLQVLGSYGFIYEKNRDKNIFKKIDKALKNIVNIKINIKVKILREFAEDIITHTLKRQ